MDDDEIRVHPMAASYMLTLGYCIEAATPMVHAGLHYYECKDAIRAAAIEAFERTNTPERYIDVFMVIVQSAFKILSKKKRGSANEV